MNSAERAEKNLEGISKAYGNNMQEENKGRNKNDKQTRR